MEYYEKADPKPSSLPKKYTQYITQSITQWAYDERKLFRQSEFQYLTAEINKLFPCEDKVYFVLHDMHNVILIQF